MADKSDGTSATAGGETMRASWHRFEEEKAEDEVFTDNVPPAITVTTPPPSYADLLHSQRSAAGEQGASVLLDADKEAPTRRLSGYGVPPPPGAESDRFKRKRSSQSRPGVAGRKESTMSNDSVPMSSSNYGLVLISEKQEHRVVPKTGSTSLVREQWSRKLEFLLSVIGFAVDLGNVWRFPYICFRNGGGAFLIPYFLMTIFGGIPLFYLELIIGQYHRSGCISIWRKICPLFKGVGYGICIMALYVSWYYNTVIAWAVYYLYSSFASELPWATCNHTWTDHRCVNRIEAAAHNVSWPNNSQSPAEQFFERNVLELNHSGGLAQLGAPKWQLVVCLLLVYIMLYFSLWKGVRSSGKVVWVTATFPYVVLLILLVRGITLPGARLGIEFYLYPKWEQLAQPTVWLEAATQVFFSLGPGFGTLIALSSYNQFNNNCFRDTIVTSIVNCFTSFMAGFVVFSVLGYMAHLLHKKTIEEVTVQGPGLLFIVYGQAMTTFSGSSFFSVIFFLMIITLGLDSSFGGLEAVITALCDEYPETLGKRRELFVCGLLSISFLGAIATTTYGGIYLITLLEIYATGPAIMTVVLVESVTISWLYGMDRFSADIKAMIGFPPGIFWRTCWKYVSPFFILFMIIMGFVFPPPLEYGTYEYPSWSTPVGWLITLSSITAIPTYAVYRYLHETGKPRQRCFVLTRPEVGGHGLPRESLAMTAVPE